jgi:DUF971 family protein
MRAVQIKKEIDGTLTVVWDDSHVSNFTMQELRDGCPCAGCKGEVLFGRVYRPAQLPMFSPGMYDLVGLTPVGQYAVQAKWKDGHDTGLYSWEYLRAICPCPQCTKQREEILAEDQKS